MKVLPKGMGCQWSGELLNPRPAVLYRGPAACSGRVQLRRDIGSLHADLPPGAIMHDPNAYLKSTGDTPVTQHGTRRSRAAALTAPLNGPLPN